MKGLQFHLKWIVGLMLTTPMFGCKKPAQPSDVAGRQYLYNKNGKLSDLRQRIGVWSQRCGVSVSKDECEVGDSVLFNGLLCLSGDSLSCEAVRRSQGSDGRMWRAELRVASDAVNSFSRDMAMGVLAYLLATKDKELAARWLGWIESNGNRLCRESSDNRCEFSPGFWALFRDVWLHLDFPLNDQMKNVIVDDSVVALLQAQLAPKGYQLHLAGVNLLLRRTMGERTQALDALAHSLASRQSKNPFFAYLAEGPSMNVVEKTSAWCPAEPPSQRTEWSFERDELDRPWERSMGWECVFLINTILRDAEKLSRSEKGEPEGPR